MSQTIGILGLGLIGSVVAARIGAAGYRVIGHDPAVLQLDGVVLASCPSEVFAISESVILCLPDGGVPVAFEEQRFRNTEQRTHQYFGKMAGVAKDSVALHLVSRVLGGGGSWGGVVENWIELTFKEYAAFRPPVAKLGERWRIKPEVSAKLLTHFYPSTENNDVSKNVFDHQRLDAKVIAVDGEEETATLRLSGALKMKHTFYNKDDSNVAQAEMVGFVQLDLSTSTIREFGLITTEATYGGGKFAVGLRLVALPKNQ